MNELKVMPGNLIRSVLTGEIVVVDWLVIKHIQDGNMQAPLYDNSPVYEPITLTEDILVKLGFEKLESENGKIEFSIETDMNTFYLMQSENGLWTIYILTSNGDAYRPNSGLFPITWTFKHIHFLQNAWPILTGTELTITL